MSNNIYIFHVCLTFVLVFTIFYLNEKNHRLNYKFETFRERIEKYNDKFIEDNVKLQASIKHATNAAKAMLRDRIIQACRFFIEQEEINYIAKENIKEMYRWYCTFINDDIFIDQLFTKCMDLPVVKGNTRIPAVNPDCLEAFEELKECQKTIED